MDYEDIIKLQEESPVYSTGNNSNNLRHCMAAFYDNDSELQRQEGQNEADNIHHISFEQAIDYLQNYVDIIDTPLDDVLTCFESLQCGHELDRNILRKKILKRKQLLKRYRAKNRIPKNLYSFDYFPEILPTQIIETEAQIKKKRNRVSAQISRDRKKLYFKQLELQNQQLQQEIIRARLENEKLKIQAQSAQNLKPKIHSDSFNNKLTKLLIFLGIICLIGMLKNTFFSAGESWGKFKSGQKLEQFPAIDTKLILEQAMPKVMEFLEDEQVERQLAQDDQTKAIQVCMHEDTAGNSGACGNLARLVERIDQIKAQIEL